MALAIVGRFESRKEDFDKHGELISLEKKLLYMNQSILKKNYHEYYDYELNELVMKYYQTDIYNFEYKF